MKKILTVFIAIVISSCKASSMAELDEVSDLVFNEGYGETEVLEIVNGVYYKDMAAKWGEPNCGLSGFWGDIWGINDGENKKSIIVYYNSDGFAEHVIIDDIEEKETNNSVNYDDGDPPLYYMDDNFFELLNNGEYSSDEVLRMLSGVKYSELYELWGEPDGMVTCVWGDVWDIGNNKQITVFYNSIGFVENVIIGNI